ncbi:hypothetical protein PSFL111601_27800 [Pseudomonas floridensis]
MSTNPFVRLKAHSLKEYEELRPLNIIWGQVIPPRALSRSQNDQIDHKLEKLIKALKFFKDIVYHLPIPDLKVL